MNSENQSTSRLHNAPIPVRSSRGSIAAMYGAGTYGNASLYLRYGKRVLDLFVAIGSLLALSPLMIITAISVALDDGRPILFLQARVGRRGKRFQICKFRSLPVNVGDVPSAKASALTPTRIGKIIRRTNIDELPQLINILKGDMSVVGPRPALATQTELLAMRFSGGVMEFKPGLTGLAQIKSYDGMPETEKVRWDVKYASEIGFVRDLTIILRTIGYLTRRPPVY